MEPIESLNPNPMQEAHLAPRCQHIRMNGRRCGSPALRSGTHCYFHDTVNYPGGSYALPFPEDATSLQYGVMMVVRMLISGHVEISRCWALLGALQIANSNLRAFAAERVDREIFTKAEQKSGGGPDPRSLAGVMAPLLDANAADEQTLSVDPEDFARERKRPDTSLLGPDGEPRMERIGGVSRPPLPHQRAGRRV